MVKFSNFLPSNDTLAGLKDNISFQVTNLSPFEPNTEVPAFEEGLTSFYALTDIEASREIQKEGSILYINVDPSAPTTKVVIDDLTLIPASQQQVIDEVQRVSEIRKQVRAKLSNFIAITYDQQQLLTSSQEFTSDTIIKLSFAKKGEVLDFNSTLSQYKSISPTAFTNYVVGSSTVQYLVTEIVSNIEIKLNKVSGLAVGSYFTITNPKYFIQGAKRSDYVQKYNEYPPRDVIFVKIKEINSSTKVVTLDPTTFSPLLDQSLFSLPEKQAINQDGDLVVACAGIPVLYDFEFSSVSISLTNASTLIEGEIPVTKIYLPKTKSNTNTIYIGNLNRESLNVILYDDEDEVFLIKNGEAQPAVSATMRLLTEKDSENYGNVSVTLQMQSFPAKIQTSNFSSAGSTLLGLRANIDSIPARVGSSTNDKESLGEYYFSYRTQLPSGQIIDLNKFGTIRVKDKVSIYNTSGTLIETNVVKAVDIKNDSIILERPLGFNIPTKSIVQIDQTPLNPGRKYRVSISALDRAGLEGFQQFTFKTKSLPQTKGSDGAHWEKIPLASFPPTLDLTIPDSFANSVSTSITNMTDSWDTLNSTLIATTQNLQNLSCSVGSLVDGLKNAQNFATSFANKNNNTQIYVRQIGLDPVGIINSQQAFMSQVTQIMNDSGISTGQIPKLTVAQVPLDPASLVNALSSSSSLESAIGGNVELGGSLGSTLDNLGISASAGLNYRRLSNDESFTKGFSSSTVEYKALSILKKSATTAEVSIEGKLDSLQTITISGSSINSNNGTFTLEANGIIVKTSLGSSITTLRYKNNLAITENNSSASVRVGSSSKVNAVNIVRAALEQENLYGPKISSKTASISQVIDALIKHNVICVNPDLVDQDKSIAIERLTRIAINNPQRIGGIVFVGRAPNLVSLVRKAQVLANAMEWLRPLTDRLSSSILTSAPLNSSGINYDPTNIDVTKISAQNNVAKQDVASVNSKVTSSGVLNYQMPTLKANQDNPPDTDFTAWRHYTPVQLMPSLQILGKLDDSASTVISNTLNSIMTSTKPLGTLIEESQQGVQSAINQLAGLSSVIDAVSNDMNDLNTQIVDGINLLKNLVGAGPISLEGHLIGSKLDMQSNQEFIEAVNSSLNDATDPNRPTFGSAPTSSTLDVQSQLRLGTSRTSGSTLWFGIILVVVGKDRSDLGEQLSTLADLFSMSKDSIDMTAKSTITFSGMKI